MLRATPFAAGPFLLLAVAIGGLGASILAPWGTVWAPRELSGGQWEQQDGLEGLRQKICIDFVSILRPFLESCLGIEA